MPDNAPVPESRVLVAGEATGPVMVLDEPLSFWGGLDAETGLIIDRHHPQAEKSVTGTVLAMSTGRGSSSASSVLAEAIRLRTAPAAIVLLEPDEIIVLGAVVAEELYGISVPVVVVDETTFARLRSARSAEIDTAGRLALTN